DAGRSRSRWSPRAQSARAPRQGTRWNPARQRKAQARCRWTLQSPQHSIPLRRPGKGIVDDAAIAMRERVDLGHLIGVQLEVEDRGILREPLQLAGARDDDDLLLHQEAQAH